MRNSEPILDGEKAIIRVASGQRFTVDAADLEKVRDRHWYLYGSRIFSGGTSLHVQLLGKLPENHAVIHINGDRFDFRRKNLAVAPFTLHVGRNRKTKYTKNYYKGVKRQSSGSWQASLAGQYLGSFPTEAEAARAYDEAARRRFGVFAALNFPRAGEISCTSRRPAKEAL